MSTAREQKFEQNRQKLFFKQIPEEEYKLRQKLAIIFNFNSSPSVEVKDKVGNPSTVLTEQLFQDALEYYRSKSQDRSEHQSKILSTKLQRTNLSNYKYRRQQKENILNYLMSLASFAEIINAVEDDEILDELLKQTLDRWTTLTLEEQLIIDDFQLALKGYIPSRKKTYSILEALTVLKNKEVDNFLEHNRQSRLRIMLQVKKETDEIRQIELILSSIYYLATKEQILDMVKAEMLDKAIAQGRKLVLTLSQSSEQIDKDSADILTVLLNDLGATGASEEQRTIAVKKIQTSIMARATLVKALEPEDTSVTVKPDLPKQVTKNYDDNYKALPEIKENHARKTIQTKDVTPKELKPIRLSFFKNFDGTRPSLTHELGLKHVPFGHMCDWLLNYEPKMDPAPKKAEPADLLNVRLI